MSLELNRIHQGDCLKHLAALDEGSVDLAFADPPRKLLNLVRDSLHDKTVTPQRIKDSLRRLRPEQALFGRSSDSTESAYSSRATDVVRSPKTDTQKSRTTPRSSETKSQYDEKHHTTGKPQEVLALYRAIDREWLSMDPGNVRRRYLAKCIAYDANGRSFCSMHLQQGGLRTWLYLKFHRLTDAPRFARDVSSVGHWGGGDLELSVKTLEQIQQAGRLIRASYQARCGKPSDRKN